jgi:type II secretory pathway pseudopilin PulG
MTISAGERGYAMAALLVALNILAVLMTVAMPLWKTAAQREKEAELIWRGEQYARAIGLFQRKYANAYPPNLDILLNERFLRKKYQDPMTKDGEFQLLYAASQGAPGQVAQQGPQGQQARPSAGTPSDAGTRAPAGARGGIMGVASKSTETGLRLYNGRSKYNEWAFLWQQANQRLNAPAGSGRPGMPNAPGAPRTPGPGGAQPRVMPPGFPNPQEPGRQQRPFGLPQRPPG